MTDFFRALIPGGYHRLSLGAFTKTVFHRIQIKLYLRTTVGGIGVDIAAFVGLPTSAGDN